RWDARAAPLLGGAERAGSLRFLQPQLRASGGLHGGVGECPRRHRCPARLRLAASAGADPGAGGQVEGGIRCRAGRPRSRDVPRRLPLFVGLAFLLFGLGTAGFALLAPLLGRPVDACWAVLLVSVQLIGGALLCGLGAIGEYVGRIYEQVKGRPLYLVKETEEAAHLAVLPHAAEEPADWPPEAA